ncbi:MAG: lipopolysaccharide biosynthesis protein [Proteobacteria bacterium]|nr:lipopolysaccharide biosynthesis protein [Pseudomonadota bacterium]
MGLRLANVPLQFALFTLIAWHYSLADVGIYALFNAAWFFSRQLGPMGLEQSSLRFIPALVAEGRGAQARSLEHRARQLVFLTIGSLSLMAGLIIYLLDIADLSGLTGWQFAAGLAALPGYALVALMAGQFRARGKIRAGQWPDSILVPIVAMVIIQAALSTGQTSLFWLLGAHAVAIWCAVGFYWLLSIGHLSGCQAPLTAADVREIRAASLTIALGSGINVLSSRLPLIFVSAIIGTPAAALYEAAQRIGALGTLGTWAAGAAVSPMLSDAHARKQQDRLQDLLIAASWTALLPALIILLGLLPWGGIVLGLFGPQYAAAHSALLALAAMAAINASASLTSNAFNMTGHEKIVLQFNFAQLVIIFVLAPLLIHFLGITGAALAIMIGVVVRDIGMGFLLPAKLGLSPGVWSLLGVRRAFRFAKAKIAAS